MSLLMALQQPIYWLVGSHIIAAQHICHPWDQAGYKKQVTASFLINHSGHAGDVWHIQGLAFPRWQT